MIDKERVITEYSELHQAKYHNFAKKVDELINSILTINNITIHSITSREKSPKSLAEKITRDGKSYDNPLEEVTDLAAVRIITYFVNDVDKILPLILAEFTVDPDRSIDKRKRPDPSIFGYASVHLIVELSETRTQLPEYAAFKGLKCEIQVRTILQHAWAEIEHDIVYKASEDIPFELRRRFASLAGLLEVADREFESLKKDEIEVRKQIMKTIKGDNINIDVNMDSLEFYLAKYHNCKDLRSSNLSLFNRFLTVHDVRTIEVLDSILTSESLRKSDELISGYPQCKSDRTGNCLLRYFIAVGTHFNVPLKNIGEEARCPLLVDPLKYSKRFDKQTESAKSISRSKLYRKVAKTHLGNSS